MDGDRADAFDYMKPGRPPVCLEFRRADAIAPAGRLQCSECGTLDARRSLAGSGVSTGWSLMDFAGRERGSKGRMYWQGPAASRSTPGTVHPALRSTRSPTAAEYGDSDVEPMDVRLGVCASGMASTECDGVQAGAIIWRRRSRSNHIDSVDPGLRCCRYQGAGGRA
jgi:hypothetical protein